MWHCRCECGRENIVQGGNLRSGDSKGCRSCHLSEMNITHGQSGTRLYCIRGDMIQRCENPNQSQYKNYGGRGIKVCKKWRKDFVAFRKWALKHGYKKGLTIDRINNDGNYEPKNCRFVTAKEQQRNKRNNTLITIKDETKTFSEWCEIAGIGKGCLQKRLKNNWPEEKLLNPVN